MESRKASSCICTAPWIFLGDDNRSHWLVLNTFITGESHRLTYVRLSWHLTCSASLSAEDDGLYLQRTYYAFPQRCFPSKSRCQISAGVLITLVQCWVDDWVLSQPVSSEVNRLKFSLVNQCLEQSDIESVDEFVSESVFSAVKQRVSRRVR